MVFQHRGKRAKVSTANNLLNSILTIQEVQQIAVGVLRDPYDTSLNLESVLDLCTGNMAELLCLLYKKGKYLFLCFP